ncbi:MAG TPA: hypothetical protein VMZ33_06110, partial [Candidatus Limnocylindrales bacterium]|nr:hypothetical protein [Candidatus Limnocylindrales bacterium]
PAASSTSTRPSTAALASDATAGPTAAGSVAASPQASTPPPVTPDTTPEQLPTQAATSSPASSGADLAALLQSLAPALATFGASSPVLATGEEVLAQLQASLDEMSAMFPGHSNLQIMQDEIDAYTENGLVERASFSVDTTPPAGMLIYRYESEAGAAADFAMRNRDCDEINVPAPAIVDIAAKSCNTVDSHNDVYLNAHRGDLVVILQVRDLPEDQPIEPAAELLGNILRAVDPLLTR